jgi:TPR repeat protein
LAKSKSLNSFILAFLVFIVIFTKKNLKTAMRFLLILLSFCLIFSDIQAKKKKKHRRTNKKSVARKVHAKPSRPSATLLASTDSYILLLIDDNQKVVLKPSINQKKISISVGEHTLAAKNMRGKVLDRQRIYVKAGDEIPLKFQQNITTNFSQPTNIVSQPTANLPPAEKVQNNQPAITNVAPETKFSLNNARELYESKGYQVGCDYLKSFQNDPSLDAKTLMYIGNCYKLKEAGEPNYKNAEKFLLKATAKGNVKDAGYLLGQIYMTGGFGLEKSTENGTTWLRNAADEGNYAAKYEIGRAYMYGLNGVLHDEKIGISYLEQAAYHDISEAQTLLINIFTKGTRFTDRDPQKTQYWQKRIADKKQ